MSETHEQFHPDTDVQGTVNPISEHAESVSFESVIAGAAPQSFEPVASAQKSVTSAQEPAVSAQEPVVPVQAPVTSVQEPVVPVQEPVVSAQEPVASAQEPVASVQEPVVSAQEPANKPSLLDSWNAVPNLVTYSRIVLVVVFLGLYIAAGAWGLSNLPMRWAAAILFIIAASTDKLDGWMARKYNQVTELGKLMDPIADKLLTCGALVVASAFGEFPWWATALFLVREIGITVMRFVVMERPSGKVIAAARPGKLKTVFQYVGLSMLLLPVWQFCPDAIEVAKLPMWLNGYLFVTYVLLYLALFLCLYSGYLYLHNTFGGLPKKSAKPRHSR
ncbi:CDP-diacylglycerol--glycerol-3-phosphate 3-phosphatidyltransferase [Bifidobacterium sp. DSM 109963]|uniref:CDP-diacylglycerol--glycerol-3-phosphate 3-phosphatidyltransferase n=1 Tax=Bifidobacterium panos TaxID=2675321 RepID=A0ABX1T0Q5_9BIFI|nr:CDP-diacylglycerol--glycerol-3-phosphate 3-phosphatidyltransferase [Bifidobacterium sp. DSM 109963]